MLVILSIIAGAGILGILGTNVLILRQNAHIAAHLEGINKFLFNMFNKPDKDSDPPIIQFITHSADLTGQRVAQNLMQQNRAAVGGSMKGVNAALKNEAVAAYPDLAIADAIEKTLPKNPLAQAGLGILINRILSGGGVPGLGSLSGGSPPPGGNNHQEDQMKFTI